MIVVDGNKLILGRMASKVAKKLLQGEEVHLFNAQNIIITGDRLSIIENYLQRRRLQHKGTPERSPKWPRIPHLLVRRIIRGMLPWKTKRGKDAYGKLRVYSQNPKNLEGGITFEDALLTKRVPNITIKELCKELGM